MIIERGEKLEDLETKAANLEEGTYQFQKTAVKLKKKMWWEDMKMKLCLGGILATILLIIIIIVSVETSGNSDNDSKNDKKDEISGKEDEISGKKD